MTQVTKLPAFYEAEGYHEDYATLNPRDSLHPGQRRAEGGQPPETPSGSVGREAGAGQKIASRSASNVGSKSCSCRGRFNNRAS